MIRVAVVAVLAIFTTLPLVAARDFKLAPAVALEAEDFTVERGWKVVKNGPDNSTVDGTGPNHVSGERLLGLDAKDDTASAYHDIDVPAAGRYRLWVRYQYPAFSESRFRVALGQGGKILLDHVMGTKASPRYAPGNPKPLAQSDRATGGEGLVDEAVTTPHLAAGKARIYLRGTAQPQTPGVAARRNIDCVYLSSDLGDAWRDHYGKQTKPYPVLDAFRDTRGPRWQARITNRSDRASRAAYVRIRHVYNRIPWDFTDPAQVPPLEPGKSSDWVPLAGQDTTHFSLVEFRSPANTLDVELRPVGGDKVVKTLSGTGTLRVYLPPYPRRGELPTTPIEAIDAVLADLATHKAPGTKPTQPLCYGGWMPLGLDDDYGRKYARLYATLGFRSLHPALSGPAVLKNLDAVGIQPSRSWAVSDYRNPPILANIERAKLALRRDRMGQCLRFFDYGDEITVAEWLDFLVQDDLARAREVGKKTSVREVLTERWLTWLKVNRPQRQIKDYWLPSWGPVHAGGFRPDSSAEAAQDNPQLYVDSLLFYEESAIRFAADGAREVRSSLGKEVLCGGTCSSQPFSYPHSSLTIKWFRGGAADLGRHNEAFRQAGPLGPMANGYVAEHFMAGMRDNPRAVLQQYTMPHAPGTTEASFLQSAFSHLAHGATTLDFFGVGLNECFGESHIDHRARGRFRALRDVTHAVGMVEDLLPQSRPVRSEVALLVSESTERWDRAGTAADRAGQDLAGSDFRKTRLHFHLERLGLWEALTFCGVSPDLVTEDDIIGGKLAGYKLVVLVGDCWPRKLVPAVEKWLKSGGVVLATASSGRRDMYAQPTSAWHTLAGLSKVVSQTSTPFVRPGQELPFLSPIETLSVGKDCSMPVLVTRERLTAGQDTTIKARFADGTPAWLERPIGKGTLIYIAAHPGLAYLHSAVQPSALSEGGASTHPLPTQFDAGARAVVEQAIRKARAAGSVSFARGQLLDCRLLEAPGGFIVPVANYNAVVGKKVELSVRTSRPVTRVVSAYHGELAFTKKGKRIEITLPELGYGDLLRLEVKSRRE